MKPTCPVFHHLALLVADLARAEAFYTDTLGLPVLRRWPDVTGTEERSIWLDLGDGAFLALERTSEQTLAGAHVDSPTDDAPKPERAGYHLLALRTAREDRDVWRERLARAGRPVTHETAFTLYFTDPDGNRLGLSHWPEPALAHSAAG